jgi:hypothetical protein
MKLMDFFIELGVKDKGAKKALNDIDASATRAQRGISMLGNITKVAGGALATFAGVVAGAGVATFAFVDSMSDAIDELGDFAELNNVSIEYVQQLGYASQKTGGGIDVAKSSIQGLNKVMGEAATGVGRGAKMLGKFGLSAKDSNGKIKTVEAMMGEIADKMKDLSAQEAIAMGSKLGIDAQFVGLLQTGSAGIKKFSDRAAELGLITTDQANRMGEFTSEMEDLRFTADFATKSLGVALAPVIIDLTKQFMNAVGGPEGLKIKIAELSDWIKNEAIPALKEWLPIIGIGLVSALGLATAAMIAFTVATLSNPAVLITIAVLALVAGVVLLVKWVYSLLPAWAKTWDGIKAKFQEVVDRIKTKIAELKAEFPMLFGVISSIPWAGPFQPLVNILMSVINNLDRIANFKMPSLSGFSAPSLGAPAPGAKPGTGSTAPQYGGFGFGKTASNTTTNNITVNAPNNTQPQRLASLMGRELSNATQVG